MKSYKTLVGLIALAVLLVACFGTGSALATTLCKTGGSPEAGCGAGKGESTSEIVATGSLSVTQEFADVSCTNSQLRIVPSSSTGTPVTGSVTSFSPGSCFNQNGKFCSVIVRNMPWEAEFEGTTLTLKDEVGVAVKFECGFLPVCEYLTPSASYTIANGSPTTLATNYLPSGKGPICPPEAEWHATYSVTAPTGFTVL
jgi:hypothetical protein